MARVKYKVTAPCYFQGVYRTPDRHNIVFMDKPFGKREIERDGKKVKVDATPSYLKLVRSNVDIVDDDDAEAPTKAAQSAVDLANEHDVELSDVVGTGRDGAITEKDVLDFIEQRDSSDDDDGEGDQNPKFSDAALKLAQENDVDLAEVTGTGKDGSIKVDDVQAFIDAREDDDDDDDGDSSDEPV